MKKISGLAQLIVREILKEDLPLHKTPKSSNGTVERPHTNASHFKANPLAHIPLKEKPGPKPREIPRGLIVKKKTAEFLPRDISVPGLQNSIADMGGVHNVYDEKQFKTMVDRARQYTNIDLEEERERRKQEEYQRDMERIRDERPQPSKFAPVLNVLRELGVIL